jgi:hypothetical protein
MNTTESLGDIRGKRSITVTTPFSYCVNNRAYSSGEYKFTVISQHLLSIRNVNGGGESLFLIRPEGGAQGLARGPARSPGAITFRTFQGLRVLGTVFEPGSDSAFELISQGISRDRLKTRESLEPINCFSKKSSIHGRNTTGQ